MPEPQRWGDHAVALLHALPRTIQRLIQNQLALAVLEGRIGEGDRVIITRGPTGDLEFERAEPAAAPAAAGAGAGTR